MNYFIYFTSNFFRLKTFRGWTPKNFQETKKLLLIVSHDLWAPNRKKVYHGQGLSQAAPLRQSHTAIGIVSLKNSQGDNLSPSKCREKLERKHTRRDLFRYRSCKLKQNVESIFYRTFKVHSKVTFQSCSTAIFVGNLRQGF